MYACLLLALAAPAPPPVVERPLTATWGLVDAARGVGYVRTPDPSPRRKCDLSAINLRSGKRLWTVRASTNLLTLYRGRVVALETNDRDERIVQLDPATGKEVARSEHIITLWDWKHGHLQKATGQLESDVLWVRWTFFTAYRRESRISSDVFGIDLRTGKQTDGKPSALPSGVADLLPKGTKLSPEAQAAYTFGRAGDIVVGLHPLPEREAARRAALTRWDATTGKDLGTVPLGDKDAWPQLSADREAALIFPRGGECDVFSVRTGKKLGTRPARGWVTASDVVGSTLYEVTRSDRATKGGWVREHSFRAVEVAAGKERRSVKLREEPTDPPSFKD